MEYKRIENLFTPELPKEAHATITQWVENQAPETFISLMPVRSIEGKFYAFPGGRMLLLDAFETGDEHYLIRSYPMMMIMSGTGYPWFIHLSERDRKIMALLRINSHVARRNGKTSTKWAVWVTPEKFSKYLPTVSPAQF